MKAECYHFNQRASHDGLYLECRDCPARSDLCRGIEVRRAPHPMVLLLERLFLIFALFFFGWSLVLWWGSRHG